MGPCNRRHIMLLWVNVTIGRARRLIYYLFLAVLFASLAYMLASNAKCFNDIDVGFETPVLRPSDIYVDTTGDIYLSFAVYNRVFIYNKEGKLKTNKGIYVPRNSRMKTAEGEILFDNENKDKIEIMIEKNGVKYQVNKHFLFIYSVSVLEKETEKTIITTPYLSYILNFPFANLMQFIIILLLSRIIPYDNWAELKIKSSEEKKKGEC